MEGIYIKPLIEINCVIFTICSKMYKTFVRTSTFLKSNASFNTKRKELTELKIQKYTELNNITCLIPS